MQENKLIGARGTGVCTVGASTLMRESDSKKEKEGEKKNDSTGIVKPGGLLGKGGNE